MSAAAEYTAFLERPIIFSKPMVQAILAGRKTQTRRVVKPQPLPFVGPPPPTLHPACARWKVGDTLWVRETWKDDFIPHPDGPEYGEGRHVGYLFAADADEQGPWRPSIHMPRKAARIFLRVNAVRVERLQEISEDDARAEGITDFRDGFRWLWDAINAKRAPWSSNPWVWVITFERIKP